MTARPGRGLVIPALALLLVAFAVGDMVRRALVRPVETAPATAAPPARTARVGDAASRTMAANLAGAGRLDSATRAAALRRIDLEGADTYLPAMLEGGDSAVHRWPDERAGRPIRVGVVPAPVPGFREVFVANVAWAITRWNTVGLPIYLQQVADSAGADIVVTWAERLDSNRAGRADVTWLGTGPLAHVHVTLATHTPEGRSVLPAQMVALGLHELGHALGLGHSPVAADALHPETSATDLTTRDRRTALLLYSIPPGSLK